jgi:hypothetical protein
VRSSVSLQAPGAPRSLQGPRRPIDQLRAGISASVFLHMGPPGVQFYVCSPQSCYDHLIALSLSCSCLVASSCDVILAIPRRMVGGKGGFVHFPSLCNMDCLRKISRSRSTFLCLPLELIVCHTHRETAREILREGGGSATEINPCFCHFSILCRQPR